MATKQEKARKQISDEDRKAPQRTAEPRPYVDAFKGTKKEARERSTGGAEALPKAGEDTKKD